MENVALEPAIPLSFDEADAYRVRLFYILRSEESAAVRFNGREIGRLAKAGKWEKFAFDAGYQPKGERGRISFAVKNRGDLLVRRVDYRNYALRWSSIFMLKPRGAPFASMPGLALGAYLLVFFGVLCGVLFISRGGESNQGRAAHVLIAPGGLAAILVLHQLVSPHSMRAHPAFLFFVFSLVAIAAGPRRKSAGAKSLLPKLAVSLLAVLASVGAIEVTLRIWDPPISRPRIGTYVAYSPMYGWMNRRSVRGWKVEPGYHVRINRNGHRGPEMEEKKPPGVFRILGLGDSFTFGVGVEEEQTFLGVLEKRLREAGHRVEVLNAGVSGWGSVQYLPYFLENAKRFGTDLAIVNFFANDMDTTETLEDVKNVEQGRRFYEDRKAYQKRRNRVAGFFRLYNAWFNYSRIMRAARLRKKKNHYSTLEAERRHISRKSYFLHYDANEKYMAPLRRMVFRWKKASSELGIPIVFTYIPAGGALHHPALLGHARALESLSGEAGIPYIDLVAPLEKHPEAAELYLHPRDSHMSAKGHAILGGTMAKSLLSMWVARNSSG